MPYHRLFSRITYVFSLILMMLIISLPIRAKSLSLSDVLARYRAATDPKATAVPTAITGSGTGTVQSVLGGPGLLSAPASFDAGPGRFDLSIPLNQPGYVTEAVHFDGHQVQVGLPRPGVRSLLGRFLYHYDQVLQDGLFAGELNPGWPLYVAGKAATDLKYGGLKTIDGHKLYELRYHVHKGARNLAVRIYLDATTFRHVRTWYQVVVPADISLDPAASARQQEERWTMVETFGRFGTVNGRELPTRWRVEVTAEGGGDVRHARTDILRVEVDFSHLAVNSDTPTTH